MFKRLLLLGAECTYKTVLTEGLAAVLGGVPVPEYARRWVEKNRREVQYADVPEIFREQERLIAEAQAQAVRESLPWMVQDGGMVMPMLYSRVYFGKYPEFILPPPEHYDAIVLMDFDNPYVPEPLQRPAIDERKKVHAEILKFLECWEATYVVASGTPKQRLTTTIEYLKNWDLV